MLQKQGVEELKSLAVRLKRQFPQVFNTPYNDAKFKVRTSTAISVPIYTIYIYKYTLVYIIHIRMYNTRSQNGTKLKLTALKLNGQNTNTF